jgi:hypothetical protein
MIEHSDYFWNENIYQNQPNEKDFDLIQNRVFGEIETRCTIYEDTNGKVKDGHPSEQAHILIATFLLQFINRQKHRIYE